MDPIPESPGARRPAEESTVTGGGLGSGKRLAPMADGLAAMPEATTEAAGALEVDAGVADAMPESRAEKPVVPEEQTVLPEASEGMIGHAMWPPSPLVAPPAMKEDEVEEIEHEETRPQAVRILRK